MDDFLDRSPELRFVPDRRYTALAGGGAVLAAGAAVLAGDAPGRLLGTVAALVLAGYVVSDLVFRPRLVVSGAGIAVNAPLLRTRLAWADVERVRVDVRQRFGLRAATLEIDAGATLAVLSRRAIGTDPAEAAKLIGAFRPPS